MRTTRLVVVALMVMVVLGGCEDSPKPTGPDYTPIPDKELFAQVEALPGVKQIDVEYREDITEGEGYLGEVFVDSKADPAGVLDQALAILRQGRYRVSISLFAIQGDREISTDALGFGAPTNSNLTERYGPQPGDGKPPAATP